MRLVLDTDVFLAGILSRRGASRVLIEGGLRGRFAWMMSPPLFLEYEAVLLRAKNLAAAGISMADAGHLLAGVADAIEPVAMDFLWRPQLTDPADEMVLETAVNGNVRYLVSFNTRFNTRHLARASMRFAIESVRPGELLARHSEIFK